MDINEVLGIIIGAIEEKSVQMAEQAAQALKALKLSPKQAWAAMQKAAPTFYGEVDQKQFTNAITKTWQKAYQAGAAQPQQAGAAPFKKFDPTNPEHINWLKLNAPDVYKNLMAGGTGTPGSQPQNTAPAAATVSQLSGNPRALSVKVTAGVAKGWEIRIVNGGLFLKGPNKKNIKQNVLWSEKPQGQ